MLEAITFSLLEIDGVNGVKIKADGKKNKIAVMIYHTILA